MLLRIAPLASFFEKHSAKILVFAFDNSFSINIFVKQNEKE